VLSQQDQTAARVARNADERTLALHLAEVARHRLAGEDAQGQRLVDAQPRERVVLGVLPPRRPEINLLPPPSGGDLPPEPGVPVDELPASELGLTCLVSPTAAALVFEVTCRFALYIQQFPSYEEEREFAGHSAVPEPSSDTPANHDPPAPQRRRRRAARTGAPFRPVYRRHDVEARLTLDVPLPAEGDGRPHTTTERTALATACHDAVFGAGAPAGPPTGPFGDGNCRYHLLADGAQVVPPEHLANPEAYDRFLAEAIDRGWVLPLPDVAFSVGVQREFDDQVRVTLTLENATTPPERRGGFLPEFGLYNAQFSARLAGGRFKNMGYKIVEHDYRLQPQVYAHGRFCYLDPGVDPETGVVQTTTWPIYPQPVFESRQDIELTFVELAHDPIPPLRAIAAAMQRFDDEWGAWLAGPECHLDSDARAKCTADRAAFADERRRFAVGVDLLAADVSSDGLGQAFRWMNEAFARMRSPGGLDPDTPGAPLPGPVRSWRLFQIVFIVCNLAALAARETPVGDPLREELAIADVLWFPTGGGKSDAIFGLIGCALFYDRLRGKRFGVTAMVRFPLRMLSLQQLDRILRLVVACERVRTDAAAGGRALGEPFALGYLVGRANTPNRLTDGADDRWGDLGAMAALARRDPSWGRDHTVVPTCPYCDAPDVHLSPDVDQVRLGHRCHACQRQLPVMISDDEVYRYLPAVVVATVDKLAAVAWNPHFSHLTHGAAYACPDHGFVTFTHGAPGRQRCIARAYCTRDPREWTRVEPYDPAPALMVQDELHLLAEELGTFAAHYETLWQYLCARGSGLHSKVVAATATISDYDNQVRQLYALRPRRFPSEGYLDGVTFYARRDANLTRRLFVGALPSQVSTSGFALLAAATLREELARLAALDPAEVVRTLGLRATAPAEVADLLFAYDLQLYYANKKTDADRVHAESSSAGAAGDPTYFRSECLNGQTPLARIAETIRRIEHESRATPAAEHLGVVAGTSLVSHGIDLDRLNVQFILGMPPTIAYYVQATSRAGRANVGLVFTALGRSYARDRSVFQFFEPTHEYVNALVEPVALNRFSVHGPRKTAPGLLAGILLCDWSRDLARLARAGGRWAARPVNFASAREFQRWLQSAPAAVEDELRDVVGEAFGLGASQLDPVVARQFADTVNKLVDQLVASVRRSPEPALQRALRPRPPTSFRDIDAAVEFGVVGQHSRSLFGVLSGARSPRDDPDREVEPADEGATDA